MKRFLFFPFLLILLGCTGVRIKSSIDPNADFNAYKSFCWIDGCVDNYTGPAAPGQQEKMMMLKVVIKEVMQEKGYVNDSLSPDLLVGFHVTVEEKEVVVNQVDAVPSPPYSTDISYWNGYENYFKEEVQRFLKGTLVVDVIDAQKGAAVWQGSAERYMEKQPEVNRERMKKTIERLLADLPDR